MTETAQAFEPKTTPFKHQADTFELSKDERYWALFAEQGLGKTKMTIDTADYLYNSGKIDRVLILAPNGVHTNWITREIPKHSHYTRWRHAWRGMTTKKEEREFAVLLDGYEEYGISWFAMNIEALRTKRGMACAKKFINHRTLFVVDESTVIKNIKAQQTKVAIDLSTEAGYRRILSGTPIVQNPLDIWSQALFLDVNALPYRSWTAFKAKYAVEVTKTLQNRSFRQIVGFRQLEDLKAEVGVWSTRLLKSECLDLPDKIYSIRDVPFHKEQEQTYLMMKNLQIAQLQKEAETKVITARSILSSLNKLQQILCGFIVDEMGNTVEIPNNRLKILEQIIEDSSDQMIIWTHYKYTVEMIKKFLGDKYGHDSVGMYYGDTSIKKRDELVDDFQSGKIRFLVANSAASRGLTLTAGTTNIYFTNSYSLETRLQSEDRTHRIGTIKGVNYIDLVTPNTVDEKVLESLKAKVNLGNMVVETQWKELFQ